MSDSKTRNTHISRTGSVQDRMTCNFAMAKTLRSVFDHAVSGVALLATDGQIGYCNSAWRRLLGHDVGAVDPVGQKVSICWDENSQSTLALESFIGGLNEDWHADAMMAGATGSLLEASVTVTPLHGDGDEIAGLGVVLTTASGLAAYMLAPRVTGPADLDSTANMLHRASARLIREYHDRMHEAQRLRQARAEG